MVAEIDRREEQATHIDVKDEPEKRKRSERYRCAANGNVHLMMILATL